MTEIAIQVAAALGLIDLMWRGVQALGRLFPPLGRALARLWAGSAGLIGFRALKNRAIASRIESVLNSTASQVSRYLPNQWLFRAKVEWVRRTSSASIREGNVILRVRPDSDPDRTLMASLWSYYISTVFPRSRDNLPAEFLNAFSLAMVRVALESGHDYLVPSFESEYLKSISTEEGEIALFADLVRLNDSGLLMGSFAREIEILSETARFRLPREAMLANIKSVIDQMIQFQPIPVTQGLVLGDWDYQGPFISYGLLLVSRPPHSRRDVMAYISRVKGKIEKGITTIHLLGRSEERAFVNDVVVELLNIRNLRGKEYFPLYRDYRGVREGIGIILSVDEVFGSIAVPDRRSVSAQNIQELGSVDLVALPNPEPTEPVVLDGSKHNLAEVIEELIVRLSDFEGDWIALAELGSVLRQEHPEFTPSMYGARNLYSILKEITFLEFVERGAGSGKAVYVRTHGGGVNKVSASPPGRSELEQAVVDILSDCQNEGGWLFLGTLGARLKAQLEQFSPGLYGFTSLHDLVSSLPYTEIDERGVGRAKSYIRLKAP